MSDLAAGRMRELEVNLRAIIPKIHFDGPSEYDYGKKRILISRDTAQSERKFGWIAIDAKDPPRGDHGLWYINLAYGIVEQTLTFRGTSAELANALKEAIETDSVEPLHQNVSQARRTLLQKIRDTKVVTSCVRLFNSIRNNQFRDRRK